MSRLRAAAVLALLPVAAGGCVAAAIPIAAGGMIARDKIGLGKRGPEKPKESEQAQRAPGELKTAQARAAMQGFEATAAGQPQPGMLPAPSGALPSPPGLPAGVTATPGLGGSSGEAAAFSLQAYQALWNHLAAQAGRRQRGEPLQSVVLAPGTTLDAPRYASCEGKPLAVVFDIDESADKAADPDAPWRRWKGDGSDLVAATPGAVEGIDAARREGVAVIFTSHRSPDSAPGVTALLDRLGFGGFQAGRTLFLRGGAEAAKGDEQVRQVIAAGYCVVALVGDSLNDFSSQFEAVGDAGKRQTAATETMVAPLWGAGWFILPNPVRSTAATPSQ
ncbi:HAD family acid phosphatase [Sphingomonas sp. MS122]|uniref:HAD family acid phosphatase n=1 Tax=Sphingomonas sp. MS122 TaxID=3412683 RepID=UPI003C2ABA27